MSAGAVKVAPRNFEGPAPRTAWSQYRVVPVQRGSHACLHPRASLLGVRRRLAALGLAAVAAVSLSGCMRFNADMSVKADNTVDGSYVIAIEKGSGAAMGGSDADVAQGLYNDSGLQTTFQRSWTHPYSKDGYAGIEVEFRDEPLATFAPTDDRFGISREGDEFVVSGKSSATKADEAADGGETPEMTVTLAFPGHVTSSNGTIHGRSVTWNLVGGPPTLEARASAIPIHSPLPSIAMTILVAAVAALTFWPRGVRQPKPQRSRAPERAPGGHVPR